MMMDVLDYLPDEMKTVVLRFYSRYVRDSILREYGDEDASENALKEETLQKKRKEEEERLKQYRKEQQLLKLDKQDDTYEKK